MTHEILLVLITVAFAFKRLEEIIQKGTIGT